ncbi:MAG: hypothetical protein JWO93_830 [Micrococcaceae bacterium]|nr:hypothetical protein [Micrococcaceae bacterium]
MPGGRVYLDVDGVLCPFEPTGTTAWGHPWEHIRMGSYLLSYAGDLIRELNALSGRPGVEFVWLTSWEDLAPRILCPAVGLRGTSWPVLRAADVADSPTWWKWDAIQQDIERHGPERVAWLDDQLNYDAEARGWAELLGRNMLWRSPHPRLGLSRRDVAEVAAFLAGTESAGQDPTGGEVAYRAGRGGDGA